MNSLLPILASKSRLTVADTAKIVLTAPKRYKIYTIPRRSGGERLIAHPARELKAVQRALIELFADLLPVSSAATAYEKGCSIKGNAEVHRNSVWIAKFDLRNFFNSIREPIWSDFLVNAGVDFERIELSRTVFFWLPRGMNAPCLSVGAPSSPFASNRFMLPYDQKISERCLSDGLLYTRYADDITISGSSEVEFATIHSWLKEIIEGPGVFKINEEKSRFLTKGTRRAITGVVITNDGELSIGRQRRRLLEARVHRFLVKSLDDDVNQLRGELAFLKMIDGHGFERLKERFGNSERAKEARLF